MSGTVIIEPRSAHVAIGWPARLAIAVLAAYKAILSPLLPRACRFEPTCSEYAREAIGRHGLARGAILAIRRLARCRPGRHGGFDPVP
jgi:putative membrane protein insertion efficiency factor